ncbi:cupin domain-containing protein [Luteibacter jiangsuensis]|uniref:Cupin domain-containing protein n=1 Tax=Luteibacter jiangsuensis TaxID=637577 RepID=A0ABX0PZ74_9GAMM|nr:cupin domain-containing protein [Luteibacter jiangsuensis]NID03532.1 cupin domain-containing protein [Luteibacter jiangsuensis]
MRTAKLLALLLAVVPALALAQKDPADGAPQPDVKDLMTKALKDNPGKEITLISVDYPPGAIEHVHRHDAHAMLYVIEGNIVMGVKGKPEQTLNAGDTFYEGPDDIHTVGRNASKTEPARFVVFILKDKGKPLVMPVH